MKLRRIHSYDLRSLPAQMEARKKSNVLYIFFYKALLLPTTSPARILIRMVSNYPVRVKEVKRAASRKNLGLGI